MKFPSQNEQSSVGAIHQVRMSERSWEEICKIFVIPEITSLASKKKLECLGKNP